MPWARPSLDRTHDRMQIRANSAAWMWDADGVPFLRLPEEGADLLRVAAGELGAGERAPAFLRWTRDALRLFSQHPAAYDWEFRLPEDPLPFVLALLRGRRLRVGLEPTPGHGLVFHLRPLGWLRTLWALPRLAFRRRRA